MGWRFRIKKIHYYEGSLKNLIFKGGGLKKYGFRGYISKAEGERGWILRGAGGAKFSEEARFSRTTMFSCKLVISVSGLSLFIYILLYLYPFYLYIIYMFWYNTPWIGQVLTNYFFWPFWILPESIVLYTVHLLSHCLIWSLNLWVINITNWVY